MTSSKVLNKKCSCGSSRKARYCCSKQDAIVSKEIFLQKQVKKIAQKLPNKVSAFLQEFVSREMIAEAWFEFSMQDEEGVNTEFLPIFIPWMFYLWKPSAYWKTKNLSQKYLNINKNVSDLEAEYIKANRKSNLSFYQIVEKKTGNIVVLKDVLLSVPDKPSFVEVYDRSFSENGRIGYFVLTMVVELRGVALLEGAAPIPIAPYLGPSILSLRDFLDDHYGRLDKNILKKLEEEVIEEYWNLAEDMSQPMRIQNTSGDELIFHKQIYDIKDVGVAIEKLCDLSQDQKRIKELKEAVHNERYKHEDINFVWASSEDNPKLGGPTTLADIRFKDGQLFVTTNSDERAMQVRELIEQRLGSGVNFKLDVIDDPDFASLAEREEEITKVPSQKPDSNEMNELLQQLGDKHKKKWFDSPVPMLGGLTPREAAKSKKGRELIEMLISVYNGSGEISEAQDTPHDYFNPTEKEIRDELKLDGRS